jgi:hypothetical protein
MMFTPAILLLLAALLALRSLRGSAGWRLPADWAARTELEVTRLRGEVERLSSEVTRLEEEQSFLLRLLGTETRPELHRGSGPADGESAAPPGDLPTRGPDTAS